MTALPVLLEVCVDSAQDLDLAVAHGADRIELCQGLALGGLTPSPGLMRRAAGCGLPVLAMIRPRPGDFVWGNADIQVMLDDIAQARQAGLSGVVLGASLQGGQLDTGTLERLVAAAAGMDLTLHRCFDLTPDRSAALEQAVALGFRRILTSGGARTAPEGAAELARLFDQAAGRIGILPGSGITAATLPALRHLPLTGVHASCGVTGADRSGLGFGATRRLDPLCLRDLRDALR